MSDERITDIPMPNECKNCIFSAFKQGQPRWIPVTERLPERFGRFIVTIVPDAGELWKTVEFAMYSDLMGLVKTPVFWQGNVGKSDFEDVTRNVTAWMPRPEPYKEATDAQLD